MTFDDAQHRARLVLRQGTYRLHRLAHLTWEVRGVLVWEDDDGKSQPWAHLYCPEMGSFLVRLDDQAEVLHQLPRVAARATPPLSLRP